MNTVLLSIKTDSETKEQLKSFAAELGVSSTALVNMVVKQAIRERRVVLSAPLEPTPYLEEIMRNADADYKADRNITHTKTKAEALAHLDSLMKK
jgi:antitoxin component of RelBE/YafQ-DinJ toxin-antitoxin module